MGQVMKQWLALSFYILLDKENTKTLSMQKDGEWLNWTAMIPD